MSARRSPFTARLAHPATDRDSHSGQAPVLALAATLALVAAACGGPTVDGDETDRGDPSEAGDPTDDRAAASGEPDALDGDWELIGGTGPEGQIDAPTDPAITLSIEGDGWRGTAACNTYQSTVTVDGGSLTIADIAVTEMGCADQALMTTESRYLAALTAVDTWSRDGDTLTLAGGDAELTFDRQAPEEDATLVGTTWTLTSLAEGDGPDAAVSDAPTEATLRFADDGSLTGSTGCNDLGSTYGLDDSRLTVDEPEITQEGCPDDLTTEQEQHVLAVLGAGSLDVEVEGRDLTLTSDDGLALHYRADG